MVAVGSLAVLPAIAKVLVKYSYRSINSFWLLLYTNMMLITDVQGIMVRRERQRALQSRFKTADTR
jgi:acyl carrier protein phosphodiesterase